MNVKSLILAVASIATTTSAFAQEFVQPDAGFVSTKSRAEVVSELDQARAAGTLRLVDSEYPVIEFAPARSRDDVLAELSQAREDGTLDLPEHAYPVVKASGTPKTREQVKSELAEYVASGGSQRSGNH